jgi:hypothetical protein
MSETPVVLKKVKMLMGRISNTVGDAEAGDIVDLPEAEADDYIARGLAQFMDEGIIDTASKVSSKK